MEQLHLLLTVHPIESLLRVLQTCRMLPMSQLFMCLAASTRTPATPSCASLFRYPAILPCTHHPLCNTRRPFCISAIDRRHHDAGERCFSLTPATSLWNVVISQRVEVGMKRPDTWTEAWEVSRSARPPRSHCCTQSAQLKKSWGWIWQLPC